MQNQDCVLQDIETVGLPAGCPAPVAPDISLTHTHTPQISHTYVHACARIPSLLPGGLCCSFLPQKLPSSPMLGLKDFRVPPLC